MDETQISSNTPSDSDSFVDKWWLIGLGIVVLAIAFLFCLVSFLSRFIDHETVIYILVTNTSAFIQLLWGLNCCLIPWIFLVALFGLFDSRNNFRGSVVALGCTIFAVILIVIGTGMILFSSRTLIHVETAHIGKRVFNLAAFQEYDDFDFTYLLYDCSTGWRCFQVHQDYAFSSTGRPNASLQVSPEANTISILANGEPIYTYTLE